MTINSWQGEVLPSWVESLPQMIVVWFDADQVQSN